MKYNESCLYIGLQIKKHASDYDLKVYCYTGVQKNYTLPPVLASYDIVLTTFQTLRNESFYVSISTKCHLVVCITRISQVDKPATPFTVGKKSKARFL